MDHKDFNIDIDVEGKMKASKEDTKIDNFELTNISNNMELAVEQNQANKAEPSKTKILRESPLICLNKFFKFFEDSTIPGLPRCISYFTEKKWVISISWFLLFSLSFSYGISNIIEELENHFNYVPTYTPKKIFVTKTNFPYVTFCNFNPFNEKVYLNPVLNESAMNLYNLTNETQIFLKSLSKNYIRSYNFNIGFAYPYLGLLKPYAEYFEIINEIIFDQNFTEDYVSSMIIFNDKGYPISTNETAIEILNISEAKKIFFKRMIADSICRTTDCKDWVVLDYTFMIKTTFEKFVQLEKYVWKDLLELLKTNEWQKIFYKSLNESFSHSLSFLKFYKSECFSKQDFTGFINCTGIKNSFDIDYIVNDTIKIFENFDRNGPRDELKFYAELMKLPFGYGYDLKDMLIACKFNDIECGPNDFFEFWHSEYGLCHTYFRSLNTSKIGPKHGLHLELAVGK